MDMRVKQKMKLVMVGNGMAGVRALEELLKIAPDLHDITVFGAEPHPNYNRILLSPVLAGEQTLEQIVLNDWAWYRDNGITLHAGSTVTTIDRVRRVVKATAADGTLLEAGYDRLILATGSNPFMLPVPGRELQGVLAYRDIADTQAMIDAATRHRHAVVIGGGLLGLEAANGLIKRGMDVTVVHVAPWLMERQLDEVAGRMLQQSLEQRGMKFLIGAQTEALLDDGQGRVGAVRFKDGTEVPAELVVMAVGIRPNTALAQQAGLHVERGIVVSDTLQTTTDARIYAVGECASVGLHGANRLGSNSLSELLVFGRVAGEQAAQYASQCPAADSRALSVQSEMSQRWLNRRFGTNTTDSVAQLRHDMTLTMEQGCGIYRTGEGLLHCQQQLQALQQRYQQLKVTDRSKVFNSELLQYLELGFGLDVALAICTAAMARTESRGAHQRLDSGMTARNDAGFLCHSQLCYRANSLPQLSWQTVQISSLPPAERSYRHVAFSVADEDLPACEARLRAQMEAKKAKRQEGKKRGR